MTAHWYVLQSKVHKEEVLWQRLRSRGYEMFYPRLFVYQKRTKSLKIKPYFPGYLFVHLNLDLVSISHFQWMPDAVGLIDFGGKPASVPDQFIQAIQNHLEEVAALKEKLLVGFDEGEQSKENDGLFGAGSTDSANCSAGNEGSSGEDPISLDNSSNGYRAFFNTRLSGKDRVRALYQMLRDKAALTSETNLAP